MSQHRKLVSEIVDRTVKAGKVVGRASRASRAGAGASASATVPPAQRSTALAYHSYDASLVDADFRELLPPDLRRSVRFDVLRRRDPRFFQFQDTYYLSFPTHAELREYTAATALARIHRTRVRLRPVDSSGAEGARLATALRGYAANLRNAWDSRDAYFAGLALAGAHSAQNTSSLDNALSPLSALAGLRPLEQCSALVWNLPAALRPQEVRDRFWFYDIRHCFKLYWDDARDASPDPSSLHYFAFNSTAEAQKFKSNFHGTLYNGSPSHRRLVETLGQGSSAV